MIDVYGFIYLLRNKVNGKVYIGQTIYPIAQRWKYHINYAHSKRNKKMGISYAILKYGAANFDIVELGRAFSKVELDEMEIRAIWSHDSLNKHVGYNRKHGGHSGKHTEDTKREMSRTRAGENNGMFGRTGEQHPLFGTEGWSRPGELNPFYGKKHTIETLDKLRRPKSEEAKAKMRASARKRWDAHKAQKAAAEVRAV